MGVLYILNTSLFLSYSIMSLRSILYVALVCTVFLSSCRYDDANSIVIKNDAGQILRSVELEYTGQKKRVALGTLHPWSTYIYKLDHIPTEESIHIRYRDQEGNTYHDIVVGYLLVGSRETHTFVIGKTNPIQSKK